MLKKQLCDHVDIVVTGGREGHKQQFEVLHYESGSVIMWSLWSASTIEVLCFKSSFVIMWSLWSSPGREGHMRQFEVLC